MSEPAPLLVFSDDWGRHPSSCQHIIRHLIPHRRVTWVNTIGLRRPRMDWATASRGFEKLRSWFEYPFRYFLPSREGLDFASPSPLREDSGGIAPRPQPRMWPSFRSRFARQLNRRLLTRRFAPPPRAGRRPSSSRRCPSSRTSSAESAPRSWVYYCVDDYSVWPGLDGRTIRDMEAELVPKVDVVIAVSETLQAHLANLGCSARLLTHGVEPHAGASPFAVTCRCRWPR